MCETFVLIVFFALARLNQQAVLRSCSSTLPWRFDARHMFGTMEWFDRPEKDMDLIKEDVDVNHEEKTYIYIYITNKKPTFPKPTKYVIWQTTLSLLCTKKGFD